MPISSGNSATTSSSNWLRRRKKVTRSSLPKNRRSLRTVAAAPARPGACPGAGSRSSTSALDIEALPGQADEKILKAGRLHRQRADADAAVHQLRGAPLRLGVAELGGDQLFREHRGGEAELREHLAGRRHVAGADRDPPRGGAAPPRQL